METMKKVSLRKAMVFVVMWALVFNVGIISATTKTKTTKVAKPVNLTLSVAASLKDAMGDITKLYKKENPNVTLTFNFGSSGSLQQQIENGAPVDVFISAGKKQVDALKTKKLLINDTIKNILQNRLVLVVPKDSDLGIKSFADLSDSKISKIAMGEPKSVPAGQYGEQVLNYYKILDTIKDKIVYAKDVREVLSWVKTGNADAGLVYKTDAKVSDKVKVIATAPLSTHSPIIYPAAVVSSTKNKEEAKKFLKFLSGSKAIQVFKKYDFEIAGSK